MKARRFIVADQESRIALSQPEGPKITRERNES